MADTRTISDEETTLDQLTEKSSLANSDLFLTRNNANTDYKVKFETLKDTLIGGDVAAGNTKAVSGSTVNSALTNYQSKNYATLTSPQDANNATSNGIVNSYRVSQACSNIPIAKIGILTVYGYVSGSYHRTTQEYITNDETKDVKKYIREGYSNNNGSTWNWGEWQQLATESSVNTTLTDYFKVPLKQMNINSPYCDSAKNKLYYYRIGDLITIKGNFTAKIDNPAWNGVFVTANTNIKPQTAQTIKDFSGKDTLYIYTDGRIQNAIALVKDTSYYFEFTYIAN